MPKSREEIGKVQFMPPNQDDDDDGDDDEDDFFHLSGSFCGAAILQRLSHHSCPCDGVPLLEMMMVRIWVIT